MDTGGESGVVAVIVVESRMTVVLLGWGDSGVGSRGRWLGRSGVNTVKVLAVTTIACSGSP